MTALAHLPELDAHAVEVAAPPERTWEALVASFGGLGRSSVAQRYAALVGCRPAAAYRWEALSVGSSVPGFAVLAVEAPHRLVLAGQHRFSRYGIEARVVAAPGGSVCALESRAVFPGLPGRLYRGAVVSSGGHVVAVRRILAGVRRGAEAD